jgi:hypothetical protein
MLQILVLPESGRKHIARTDSNRQGYLLADRAYMEVRDAPLAAEREALVETNAEILRGQNKARRGPLLSPSERSLRGKRVAALGRTKYDVPFCACAWGAIPRATQPGMSVPFIFSRRHLPASSAERGLFFDSQLDTPRRQRIPLIV